MISPESPRGKEDAMFQALYYQKKQKPQKVTDFQALAPLLKNKQDLLWVDITEPSEEDIDILTDIFGIHHLAVEDAIFPQNYPKIEEYDGYLFVAVHETAFSSQQENTIDIRELNLMLGPNFVLTIHNEPVNAVAKLFLRCQINSQPVQQGPGFLLHAILDHVVDSYFPLMDQLEKRIEVLEDRVLANAEQSLLEKIADLRKAILTLRNFIQPQRRILSMLGRPGMRFIRPSTSAYFRDVYDHVVRIGDSLDTYRDVLNSTMDVYISVVSQRMNQIMKTLTIITTILMPMSVITSFYGMNIEMPEFKWGLRGYWWVMGLLLLAAAGILLFLKKRKWI
jgi:magnesium transporter